MSHEIRTPLNVILSYNSFIQDELGKGLGNEWHQVFNSIDSASKRLMRTIDLILNMSMIQTGRVEIRKEKVDLVFLLKNTIYSFKSIADNKKISLVFSAEFEAVDIESDEYILGKIFDNLIDNAIKFTFSGRVEVKLYLNIDSILCINIEDTGIGMTKEFLNKIFSPFTQEESGYSRRFEGNGLGLALVKNYVELLGAQINIQSEKNKGSLFNIILNTAYTIRNL